VTLCLIDERAVEVEGPKLREDHEREEKRRGTPSQPLNLFSDLNRWLLKVLLAPALPAGVLAAPRSRFRNATELAAAATVSPNVARRLVAALREEGFLDETKGRLTLVRVRDLLLRWRADNLRTFRELRARWLLPRGQDQLEETLAALYSDGERVALGLFAACDALGYRHVRGVTPHVYVPSQTEAFLRRADLVPAQPGEQADVILRLPRWPESLFRAAVPIGDRSTNRSVPVTDIVQCWLDVVDHPTRGEEQASLIWDRVIEPHLLRDS
jgi:hypothetical protein